MAEDSLTPVPRLLVIGGSAGSLDVLLQVLPALRHGERLAIIVVLHRRADYDSPLSGLFAARTTWAVREADDKEIMEPGVIYIAPADYHLLVEGNGSLSLDFSEKINYSRPSIDVTFESAAYAYGPALAALLLSGANMDGAAGLRLVHALGGVTAVQDPRTATAPYMPAFALESVAIDYVLTVPEIPPFIETFRSG